MSSEETELTIDPKYESMLKENQLRVTQPRKLVIQCLKKQNNPLSARELMKEIEDQFDIDQVTIYRILETFLEIGLIHQVFPSGGYLLCDHIKCQHGIHIMLHCKTCQNHKEIEIPKEVFAPLEWYLKQSHKFEPQHHLFQIDGRCDQCQSKTK